jgi:hypothetical protein
VLADDVSSDFHTLVFRLSFGRIRATTGDLKGARPPGLSIAWDMGFDVLREFWPEIVHKLKLPFRERDHQLAHTGNEQ